MSVTPTRLIIGFIAGALSHILFQGGFGALLHAVGLLPTLSWSLAPVPPLGVPRTVSLAFWAGLWGLLYAVIEPRVSQRLGWLVGGIVFGIAPLLVHWFVAQPLKGLGIGGGFQAARVPIEIGFHLVFGLGLAILFHAGVALVRPRAST